MSDDAKDVLKRNAFELLDYIIDKGFTNVLLAKNIQEFFLLLVNKREDIEMHLNGVEKYIDVLNATKKKKKKTMNTVRVDLGKLASIDHRNESAQDKWFLICFN